MDTTSKAIIIAAGMLIGILIISVSMYMLTSFRQVYENSLNDFEIQQIASFNSFFTQYGSKIKGYDVYNIIGKINEVNADQNATYFIHFDNNITREENFYYTENFLNDYSYSYEFDADGAINRVTITPYIAPADGS